MNIKNLKYVAAAMLLGVSMTSCDDFLDKPVEDNYNTENYYTDDNSCIAGVNYLYNLHGTTSSAVSSRLAR